MADRSKSRLRSVRRATSVATKNIDRYLALRAAESSIGFPVGRAVRATAELRKSQDAIVRFASLGFRVVPIGYEFTVLTPLEKNMKRLASMLATKPAPGQAYVYYKTLTMTSAVAQDDRELLVKRTMTIEIMFVSETNVIKLDNADLSIQREKIRLTIPNAKPVIDSIQVSATKILITLVESPPVGTIALLTIPFSAGPISFDLDSQGKFYFLNTIVLPRKDKVPSDKFLPGSKLPFPCFDDPRLRAPLFVTVGRPHGSISISNAPLVATTKMLNQADRNHWSWDTFSLTSPMNVEELTFLVSNNMKVFTPMIQGTSTRLLTEKSKDAAYYEEMIMPYVSEVGRQMELIVKISYAPMPTALVVATAPELAAMIPEYGVAKLGVIYAHPKNFGTKGLKPGSDPLMETYKTVASLARWDAEMWFRCGISGENNATSWLHRSMAHLVSLEVVGSMAPNVHRATYFDIAIHEVGLREDNRVPCDICIWHPHHSWKYEYEIGKGISLLKMLMKIFNDEVFWRAMNQYLTLNWLDTVSGTHEFLKGLHEVVSSTPLVADRIPEKTTIHLLFQEYFKPGERFVPTVTVTRNYDTNFLTMTQTAVRATGVVHSAKACPGDPLKAVASTEKKTWNFPIYLNSAKNTKFSAKNIFYWLRNKSSEDLACPADKTDWIIANPGRVAYARVNYDERNWKLLSKALSSGTTINDRTRACIYSDAMFFYSVNLLKTDIAMTIAELCVTDGSEYCRLVGVMNYDIISSLIPDIAQANIDSLKRVMNEVKSEFEHWLGDTTATQFSFSHLKAD